MQVSPSVPISQMNKIASIEIITAIDSIPGADSIQVASVLGWKVVVKKDQFKPGDKCIYIAIDSIVNKDYVQYKFLEKVNYRIRTVRLRNQVSQGICFPITDFGINPDHYQVGEDVSSLVGAEHYEAPIPPSLAGDMVGFLPGFLKRTDETNIKGVPELLNEFTGKLCYITTKYDGTSSTYYTNNSKFGICGRNVEFKETTINTLSRINEKYGIKDKLLSLGENIAVQGEVYGPGIQGNRLGVDDHSLVLFSAYDINKSEYYGYDKLKDTCLKLGLPLVVPIWCGVFNFTITQLQDMANNLKYSNGSPAEGIVIRPIDMVYNPVLGGHLSVKIISETFDLQK